MVANTIEADWRSVGLEIIRDKNVLRYKDSLGDYMRSMDSGDYVLLLISKGYLESKNCMFEVLELFRNPDFKKKVLPIILDSAKIHEDFSAIDYIEYWGNKVKALSDKYSQMTDLTNTIGVQEKLNLYKKIRDSIDGFISLLNDMLTVYWSDSKQKIYENIFNHIQFTPDKKLSSNYLIFSSDKALDSTSGITVGQALDMINKSGFNLVQPPDEPMNPINGAYNNLSREEKNSVYSSGYILSRRVLNFSGGDEDMNEIIIMMEKQGFMKNSHFNKLVHFIERYKEMGRNNTFSLRLAQALQTIKRVF